MHVKLFEQFVSERADGNLEFGLMDSTNAKKAEEAIKKAGLEADKSSGGGITYFNFSTKKELNAAIKAVEKVIDKSKEDGEWG